MAYPIIRIDSTTGSDTLCSGAGPGDGITAGTALNGSAASTSGDGLTVTLDGSPSLTAVLTDGSHVLWMNDATTNARTFAAITAKDNTAKTVTVALAYAFSLTGKTWAIGGRRASIGSTTSRAVVDRGGTNLADMQAGWEVRFASGHAESLSSQIFIRRNGTSNARVYFRAEPGAAVAPVFTSTTNTYHFNANGIVNATFQGLRFKCSSATKTQAVAIANLGTGFEVLDCLADFEGDSANAILSLVTAGGVNGRVENNRCVGTTGPAIQGGTIVRYNVMRNGGADGWLDQSNASFRGTLEFNLISGNAGHGVSIALSSASTGTLAAIRRNVIHGNAGDGISVAATSSNMAAWAQLQIQNNSITSNGGVGIKADGTITTALLKDVGVTIRNNNFGTGATANTSGATSAGISGAPTGSLAVDPQYINAAGGNFGVGTNLKALGWPTANIAGSTTRSYVDIGAADREEPTGGGGGSAPTAAEIATAVANAILTVPGAKITNTGGQVIVGGFDASITTGPAGADSPGVTTLLGRVPIEPAAVGSAMTLTSGERNAVADAYLDRTDGVETGRTPRQHMRKTGSILYGVVVKVGQAWVFMRKDGTTPSTTITLDGTGQRSSSVDGTN